MAKNRRDGGATAVAIRPEDERMPIGKTFAYGLQHVLTMYGGIIAPPLIIGGAAGVTPAEQVLLITSCLFIGGLATILQSLGVPFFGSQLPLVQGVSFAGVATMLAIINSGGGITGIFGAVIVASVIGLVVAPFFAMILRFFPPVVTGVVITTIGLSLMPVAAGWSMGGVGSESFGDPSNLLLALLTLVVLVVLTKFGTATIARLAILGSLVIGTVIGLFMGKTDFSNVFVGSIFEFPAPFAFGWPTFEIGAIVSMFVVILVTMTETTADILAVGEIVGTKVDSKRVAAGLRADMLSSAVAPVFNTFSQTAFAQNVGLVAITRVKSRFVVTAGGVVLVVLGLLPVLGRVVADIPYSVLGGAGIVLFGSVAAAGIQTLSKVDFKNTYNLIIIAASIAFGMLPVVQPDIYDAFPDWFRVIFDSGISSAAIMAVLLNLFFNHIASRSAKDRNSFVAAPTRIVHTATLRTLRDGDYFMAGKLVDADGVEVPIIDPEDETAVDGTAGYPATPVPIEEPGLDAARDARRSSAATTENTEDPKLDR